ncbi:unnamed protein product, partial [Prorocentrum cordatum]
ASESERVAAARAVPSCVKLTAAQLSTVPEPPATVPASRKQRGEQKQRSEPSGGLQGGIWAAFGQPSGGLKGGTEGRVPHRPE